MLVDYILKFQEVKNYILFSKNTMKFKFDYVLQNSVGCSLSQIMNYLENKTNNQFLSRYM